ncbi:MAG: winged helix-turn-helix transcriptional regulator [Cyanobacteria bacterium]|nr:winged helix-turn-helix transcriptional regulator [Cyanobacteria bacterium CG_2015-16_32_12]NCO78455.1 winged helix-turn-helix transcriptional regulator [Cyanobacteria bacterium CG_2015-22_32_23]NCQ04071.1 winged helix-turn-helix transcriptional regulator [Cyanobacteria bacterium CG_2015-09_32_10]NCQ42633.1 winged helix-turn-helix transcriptional regulator [Cyanobacteria bacterium CG_2015-04_32_10]NCS83528.1 winged helix-turn-helix transcriptional regulator [Cyanobacteria bacterium CG_2015-0
MTFTQIHSQETIILGFHALSDSIRMEVLNLLRTRELCVCEIKEILNIPQSKLSFHLKTLRETGLVNTRQQGKWTYYSINLSQLVALEQYLSEFRRSIVLLPTRICEH